MKKTKEEKQSQSFIVRLTPEEAKRLRKCAKGNTLGQYIRQALLAIMPK